MTFMEWLGYVKREQHNKMLRHKNEMHKLLAQRADRIAQLEFCLTDARNEARRAKAQLPDGRIHNCNWCGKIDPKIHDRSFWGSSGDRFFCDSQCAKAFELEKIVRSRAPSAAGSVCGAQASGVVFDNSDGERCHQCSALITSRGGVVLWSSSLPFCSNDCLSRYRNRLPRSIPETPGQRIARLGELLAEAADKLGRMRGEPAGVVDRNRLKHSNTCANCSTTIPIGGVVVWGCSNKLGIFEDANGRQITLAFCSHRCHEAHVPLSVSRNAGARLRENMNRSIWADALGLPQTDFVPDMTNMRSASFFRLCMEPVEHCKGHEPTRYHFAQQMCDALDKHRKEAEAIRAMWAAAGVTCLSVPSEVEELREAAGRAEVRATLSDMDAKRAREQSKKDNETIAEMGKWNDELKTDLRTVRHSLKIAETERARLGRVNRGMRVNCDEYQKTLEELQCQAGDLSDRLEKVEHERDGALARLDDAQSMVELRSNQLDILRNQCIATESERNRLATLLAVVNRPMTDDEAADVVMPRMDDFDCGENYVRAVDAAIREVTGKRVQ